MRCLALALVVSTCGSSAPPPTIAPPPPAPAYDDVSCVPVEAVASCHDIRGGYSGYTVYAVTEGVYKGKLVTSSYGEGRLATTFGRPARFASIVLAEPVKDSPADDLLGRGWPNSCDTLDADTGKSYRSTYDGGVVELKESCD